MNSKSNKERKDKNGKGRQPFHKTLLRDLADLLEERGLSEVEIEFEGLRARVTRQVSGTSGIVVETRGAPHAPAETAPQSQPAPDADMEGAVAAPMVGTVYLAPEPGARAFVSVGDRVQKGQTLLIIEAMKTMNHIPAPRDGTVERILVSDGQPIEFGEPLMILN